MIDGDELQLFETSLRHATATATGETLDAALRDLGWHDALDVDRRTAVSALFELQGRACTASSALDAVLARALDVELDGAGFVLPPLREWAAPGRRSGDGFEVHGLATAGLSHTHDAVVVVADGPEHRAVVMSTERLARRIVDGLDPDLGLIDVRGECATVDAGSVLPPWHGPTR